MTSQKPLVSVIIPVYNERTNIQKIIDNLRLQSYKNYEMIFADNGSKDGTYEYLATMDGLKVIRADEIKSPYYARNEALKIATGDLIALTDGNKIPDVNWISEAVVCFEERNCDLVGGLIKFTGDSKKYNYWYDSFNYLDNKKMILTKGTCVAGNLFFKTELLNEVGFFNQNVRSGGDVLWTFRASNNLGFNILFCEKSIVYYRARKLSSIFKKDFRVGIGQPLIWRKMGKSRPEIYIQIFKYLFPPIKKSVIEMIESHLSGKNILFKLNFFMLVYFGNIIKTAGRLKGLFVK